MASNQGMADRVKGKMKEIKGKAQKMMGSRKGSTQDPGRAPKASEPGRQGKRT